MNLSYNEHVSNENLNLKWRRASHCESGACVEVAQLPDGGVAVRDSKNPGGTVLRFTAAEWDAFRAGVLAGKFDL